MKLKRLFHFIVLVNTVASFVRIRFFSVDQVFELKLSRIVLLRKRLPFDSKIDSTTIGLTSEFCWKMPPLIDSIFAQTEICENCSNLILF